MLQAKPLRAAFAAGAAAVVPVLAAHRSQRGLGLLLKLHRQLHSKRQQWALSVLTDTVRQRRREDSRAQLFVLCLDLRETDFCLVTYCPNIYWYNKT